MKTKGVLTINYNNFNPIVFGKMIYPAHRIRRITDKAGREIPVILVGKKTTLNIFLS